MATPSSTSLLFCNQSQWRSFISSHLCGVCLHLCNLAALTAVWVGSTCSLHSLTNQSFHRVGEGPSPCWLRPHLTCCVLMSFELRCLEGESRGSLAAVGVWLPANKHHQCFMAASSVSSLSLSAGPITVLHSATRAIGPRERNQLSVWEIIF